MQVYQVEKRSSLIESGSAEGFPAVEVRNDTFERSTIISLSQKKKEETSGFFTSVWREIVSWFTTPNKEENSNLAIETAFVAPKEVELEETSSLGSDLKSQVRICSRIATTSKMETSELLVQAQTPEGCIFLSSDSGTEEEDAVFAVTPVELEESELLVEVDFEEVLSVRSDKNSSQERSSSSISLVATEIEVSDSDSEE